MYSMSQQIFNLIPFLSFCRSLSFRSVVNYAWHALRKRSRDSLAGERNKVFFLAQTRSNEETVPTQVLEEISDI